jgi:predicted Zn-dependent protease
LTRYVFALLFLFAGSCAGAEKRSEVVATFTSAEDLARVYDKERVLWDLGARGDEALHNRGALLSDPALNAYLQGIVDRLYPEFQGAIRARFIRNTQANAFMQPNGSTYMFTGMLAHIDSEAQLAAIMAHEGAHFIDRHSYRGYKSASSKAVFGQLVSLGGVPIAGELIAMSSIMGYSRELESTADEMGLERFRRAGYDLREAKKPFEALVGYLRANEIKEPYFFASHPQLQQRVEFFAGAETRQTEPGRIEIDDYRARTEVARVDVLVEFAKRRAFKDLIYLLEDDSRRARFPASSRHWLGIAYLQRALGGDIARAEQVFQATMRDVPTYAPPYKALGEIYMKQAEHRADALPLFARYLELAPDAPDRGYVALYIQRLTQGEGT